MCVHSISRQISHLVLLVGLLLPMAVAQVVVPSGAAGGTQSSTVQDVTQPYCQFQDACSLEAKGKAMAYRQTVKSYCQFRDACPSIGT